MLTNGILLRSCAIISLIIALYLFVVDLPDLYSYLPILPFFCSLYYLLCDRFLGLSKVSVANVLIISLSFVRYSLLSLLMYLGHFFAITSWSATQENFNSAVCLMTYEAFVIFVALIVGNLISFKFSRNYFIIERKTITKIIISLSVLFVLLVLVVYPDTLDIFMSIFQLDQLEFTHGSRIEKADAGSLKRVFQTLFSVIFFLIRVVFPVYMLKIFSEKKMSIIFYIFWTLFFVFLQFIFITSTFAESIICSLLILLCSNKLNSKGGEKLIKMTPFFIIGIFFTFFYVRYLVNLSSPFRSMYQGKSFFEHVCSLVNSYFTGHFNVAGSFMMKNENVFNVFKITYLRTIPFNSTMFNVTGTPIQTIFNTYNHTLGQISSSVGDGLFFTNTLFAPIFSFILTFLSVVFCRLADLTKSLWRYLALIFSSIIFALGIAMYNEQITLFYINQWFVPIFLMSFVCEKRIYTNTYEIKS